jgi:hypothetical protein
MTVMPERIAKTAWCNQSMKKTCDLALRVDGHGDMHPTSTNQPG